MAESQGHSYLYYYENNHCNSYINRGILIGPEKINATLEVLKEKYDHKRLESIGVTHRLRAYLIDGGIVTFPFNYKDDGDKTAPHFVLAGPHVSVLERVADKILLPFDSSKLMTKIFIRSYGQSE